MANQRKIMFFLCPGIRTTDDELIQLSIQFEQYVRRTYDKHSHITIDIRKFDYGWVGVISNVLPVIRRVISRMMASRIREFNEDGWEVILIAYSFSTFLSCKVLFSKANSDLKILYWVMFGGVVNTRTDFSKLQADVKHIINFSSLEDEIAKYAPKLFTYGHSGAYGFRTDNGLTRANNINDAVEVAWKNPFTGHDWVTNVYRNNVEHSGPKGWFGSLKYVKKMIEMLKDIK